MISALLILFRRDLDGLRAEIELYPDDASLWRDVPGCPNPGGTLILHAVGNLRHFVGGRLAGSDYVRDREAEFADRDLSREELLTRVAAARSEVLAALEALDPASLPAPHPLPFGDLQPSTGLWLTHLATHLAFHLGQLDYHRRAVTGDATSAGVMSVRPLGE